MEKGTTTHKEKTPKDTTRTTTPVQPDTNNNRNYPREKINMHQQQTDAIKHRLQKAKETWRQTKQKLFQNKTIPEKLRIQLWNALVRSTLTYALQTQEITPAQKETINKFAQKCMRTIIDSTWYTRKKNNQTSNSTQYAHTKYTCEQDNQQ